MDGPVDIWIDGRMDGIMDKSTNRWMDLWLGGWKDGRTGGCMQGKQVRATPERVEAATAASLASATAATTRLWPRGVSFKVVAQAARGGLATLRLDAIPLLLVAWALDSLLSSGAADDLPSRKPQPNMSTTFMGRSRLEVEVCRQTPRSAAPRSSG